MPNPVGIGETAPQTALPAQVDIYDFDKTLVPFDSGSLFIGYCALHYPWGAGVFAGLVHCVPAVCLAGSVFAKV